MKDLFYNTQGCNTACITIDSNGKTLELYYHLYDNPVQHLWQGIHKDTTSIKTGISTGTSLQVLLEQTNELLVKVGLEKINESVTQDELNKLHNKFVHSNNSPEWLQLNPLVHIIEGKLKSPFPDCQATVNFFSNNECKIPIKEEYKIFLTHERKWGSLLLAYATVGKDYFDLFSDNDDPTDLEIQKYITSETLLTFEGDYAFETSISCQFYKWAKNSPYDIPLDNLNKMSLGLYTLGNIIITDSFLNFHPIIGDWYIPNHKCRLTWNRDVLGANAIIKNIRFFNSDLYYNTQVEHTKLFQ